MTSRGEGRSTEPETSRSVWLLITREALWREFHRNSGWSFHRQSLGQAERINPNDRGVVYLTKDPAHEFSRLVAVVEATAPVASEDLSRPSSSFYPFLLPFRLLREPLAPISFRELVPELEFIHRKERYGIYLQGKSAILLSANDGRVILDALGMSKPAPRRRRSVGQLRTPA